MLVSLGCLILGRKRSDRFFLFWMVLFSLAFFLGLVIFRGPKIDVAERFAQALGVAAESLLELETAAPQDSVAKALAQAQAVFESGLPRRSKELFFEQIALAYFRSQQQNIGKRDDAM